MVQEGESARLAGEADDEKQRGLVAQRREIEGHRRNCEVTKVHRIGDEKRIPKGEGARATREKKRGLEEKRPQWEATGKELRMAEVRRSERMREVEERKMEKEWVEEIRRDEVKPVVEVGKLKWEEMERDLRKSQEALIERMGV